MLVFSPMNPDDTNIAFEVDFVDILAADETISSVVSVTAAPDTITVGPTPYVTDGARTSTAVVFTLGSPLVNTGYTIAVKIITSDNRGLTRSCFVPGRSV